MGIERNGAVRRNLRTLFNLGAVRELTDGQLLERFADDPGEVGELAFAAIIERHGPMVLQVCRGVLGDRDEAHDAFQATFLVLVRRGRGLWVRDSIGPWLHQVAYRTASCARSRAARHRRLERKAARDEAVLESNRDFELERILHEEINRLPDRFRSVVVLCDLEGRSYEQAAQYLGWPVGTVKSRLSRGRECLRDRLIRRGIASELGPLAVAGAIRVPAVTIPPALLDATTAAASRFVASGLAGGGPAVLLAQGVLKTMTISQWWKIVAVLTVAGVSASGAGWVGAGGGSQAKAPSVERKKPGKLNREGPIREVKRGKVEFGQISRGSLEAGRAESVYCNVEGGTRIVTIVPEGKRVKKGEVIAELDSTLLSNQAVNQRITTLSAEAQYRNARLAREVAETAVAEYREGVYPTEVAEVTNEIELSQSAHPKLVDRIERTRKALDQLNELQRNGRSGGPADIVAALDLRDRIDDAELSLGRQQRSIAQAEARRDTLKNYIFPRKVKELERQVSKAHADELAKQATWELEKAREEKLRSQIHNCTLKAPIDGLVIYASDPTRGSEITEGATVLYGEKLVQILDDAGPMLLNYKAREAWVDQLATKMKARIKVDAFPGEILEGEVVEIAPRPDPKNAFSGDIKVYTTRIRIDRRVSGLRPGMTAQAEIITGVREEAIAVPVESVVPIGDRYEVALNRPDGRVEWREVVLGTSDGRKVEITEGLREGESLILDPTPLLTEEQKAPDRGIEEADRPQKSRIPSRD